MIFDSLMGQFMLHEDDNSGPNDSQQQNQGTPTNTDQQDDAGGDEDEYTVQDPDGGEDEQDTQIVYYYGQELSQNKMSVSEYKEKVMQVSKENILSIANKVTIDTIYFLKN